LDIIGPDGRGPWSELSRPIGSLSDDLSFAIQNALSVRKADAVAYAQSFDWDRSTDQFIGALGEVTNQNA
jgi:hypothetical protein